MLQRFGVTMHHPRLDHIHAYMSEALYAIATLWRLITYLSLTLDWQPHESGGCCAHKFWILRSRWMSENSKSYLLSKVHIILKPRKESIHNIRHHVASERKTCPATPAQSDSAPTPADVWLTCGERPPRDKEEETAILSSPGFCYKIVSYIQKQSKISLNKHMDALHLYPITVIILAHL